jgi:hypothetical protein
MWILAGVSAPCWGCHMLQHTLCNTQQVIQRSVVRSVDQDRSLNIEATFPIDEYHPVIIMVEGEFPVEQPSQRDNLTEGSSVGQASFGDISVAATKDIIGRSNRLAKKQSPLPTQGPQFPVEIRRSLRNIQARTLDTVSMHVAVATALENCVDTGYGESKLRNIPDDMAGIGAPAKVAIIFPLSEHFNASQFAYLCALDQEADKVAK